MKKTVLFTSLLCMLLIATTSQARHRDNDLVRIRIEGRIESIRGQIAYIEDDCGEVFRVELGPAWYWDEHDYFLRSGCYVTVIAWQDTYDDYCYAGEIRGRDFCYDLCDSRGYPRWSNRDDCHSNWRPTRAFFDICFVIGSPRWYCAPPRHHYSRGNDCNNDRGRGHDRNHGGNWERGRDNDGDRDGREGRRDNDRGGRSNVKESGDRNNSPERGGFAHVTKPAQKEKSPTKKTWTRK